MIPQTTKMTPQTPQNDQKSAKMTSQTPNAYSKRYAHSAGPVKQTVPQKTLTLKSAGPCLARGHQAADVENLSLPVSIY